MDESENILEERQVFRVWWLWLIVLGIAILIWYGWISQTLLDKPFGQRPAPDSSICVLWITFGIALPAFLLFGSQETDVTHDSIIVRSMYLYKRRIDIKNIATAKNRSYDPLREYGGWGIRFGFRGAGRAYNVAGNQRGSIGVKGWKQGLAGLAGSG